jgi:serine dehydrogenase proteinase
MSENKIANLSSEGESPQVAAPAARKKKSSSQPGSQGEGTDGAAAGGASTGDATTDSLPWATFAETADNKSISSRFATEVATILATLGDGYCCLGLLDSETSVSEFDLDRIFSALLSMNPERDKNVLLFLLTPGGSIEPAYQMSKLCKSYARERFIVAVPRQAKSAGTLLALGADEIHMGPLGHLGPIDPQLGGLPALGVAQALKSIAAVSEQYPGSAEMFSMYLKLALTVEQIGYCERVSESAAQYAERLLQTKKSLPKPAQAIAHELVHEYKDHGFVIDLDEATQHLGSSWVKTNTPISLAADKLYNLYEEVNLYLRVYQKKRLLAIGSFSATDILVFDRPRRH